MIERLEIKNFKSIKEMTIDCKRINLFIGEPNTGKSNILEIPGLLSWFGHIGFKMELNQYIRFEEIQNLFYDGLIDEKIKIELTADKGDQFSTGIVYDNNVDNFIMENKIVESTASETWEHISRLDHTGDMLKRDSLEDSPEDFKKYNFLKFYKFQKQNIFPNNFSSYLLPPNGTNLYAMVMANKRIRELMNILVKDLSLNFIMKTSTKTIDIVKQKDDLMISFPYITASDTLQRIVFFSAAMESNKDSILVFEEPESFAFPYYTKYLGERIAFDETNQYFIFAHNPYLLLAILEKAPKNSVNVFITYLKDYETNTRKLKEKEIPKFMDSDPFLNLNYFLEDEVFKKTN